MEHLLNINKTLNILLKMQFMRLKNEGDIAQSITFSQWVDQQNIITEPPISKKIKELVFEYLTNREEFSTVRQKYRTVDELIKDNEPNRQAIYIKQLSIYFYYETFARGENGIFSYLDIGTLHNTTKQNAHKTVETVRGWSETDKRTAQHITDITALINSYKTNNNLKIA